MLDLLNVLVEECSNTFRLSHHLFITSSFAHRFAFYMATVGAAVGFGNIWRFPGLNVTYGGGAFMVPYLMSLFLIGIPLAILEIGFGQFFQTGDIGVFGGFHPRLRGVG